MDMSIIHGLRIETKCLTSDERYKIQKLARYQMQCRLLADIQADMKACKLEGWDQTEYIRELQDLLNGFKIINNINV